MSNDKNIEVDVVISQKNLSCTIFDKKNWQETEWTKILRTDSVERLITFIRKSYFYKSLMKLEGKNQPWTSEKIWGRFLFIDFDKLLVVYFSEQTSQILESSPLGLISSIIYVLGFQSCKCSTFKFFAFFCFSLLNLETQVVTHLPVWLEISLSFYINIFACLKPVFKNLIANILKNH